MLMKRTIYAVALLATMIGVAPAPAHAKKSLRQRITALEKVNAKQSKQIKTLTSLARLANARAEDAQGSFMFLSNCLLVQPAGAVDVLDAATSSSFVQGTTDGVVPDFFQWLPVTRSVVTPEGPDYLILLDPGCVAQPDPAPAGRASRHGWAPRKLTLSIR